MGLFQYTWQRRAHHCIYPLPTLPPQSSLTQYLSVSHSDPWFALCFSKYKHQRILIQYIERSLCVSLCILLLVCFEHFYGFQGYQCKKDCKRSPPVDFQIVTKSSGGRERHTIRSRDYKWHNLRGHNFKQNGTKLWVVTERGWFVHFSVWRYHLSIATKESNEPTMTLLVIMYIFFSSLCIYLNDLFFLKGNICYYQ